MHRVIYSNGQVRTVDYQSRAAALDFFSVTIRQRTTEAALLQKQKGTEWIDVACMAITPDAGVIPS